MRKIAIIPARMGSTRFPGKPLATIYGIPMVGHVYFRTKQCKFIDEVYIATCDEEIKLYAESIGAPCVMTSDQHERCTDRTAEAMLKIEEQSNKKVDIVVMVQGDEPMVTPNMIDQAVAPLISTSSINISSLMGNIKSVHDFEDPNAVKVVVDINSNALYFSREPIPSRKKGHTQVPMYKQVAIIPFRRDYLLHFNSLKPTQLEEIESVDMLRVLEHGDRIKMVLTDEENVSVDTPEDLSRVIKLMAFDTMMESYVKNDLSITCA